jgi:hypothetical protein
MYGARQPLYRTHASAHRALLAAFCLEDIPCEFQIRPQACGLKMIPVERNAASGSPVRLRSSCRAICSSKAVASCFEEAAVNPVKSITKPGIFSIPVNQNPLMSMSSLSDWLSITK